MNAINPNFTLQSTLKTLITLLENATDIKLCALSKEIHQGARLAKAMGHPFLVYLLRGQKHKSFRYEHPIALDAARHSDKADAGVLAYGAIQEYIIDGTKYKYHQKSRKIGPHF